MRLRTIGLTSVLALGLLVGPSPAKAQQEGKVPRSERGFPIVPQEPRLMWGEAAEPRIPESAQALELGRKTYSQLCVQCHGPEGRGDGPSAKFLVTKPRNFTSGVFKFRTTPPLSVPADEDLFRTITVGFPLYGMPSFLHLSSRERWALVYYVKSLAASSLYFQDASREPPFVIGREPPTTPASLKRGREVYDDLGCADCHGVEGKGDGVSARHLKDDWGNTTWPLDFTKGKAYFKTGSRPRDILRTLMTGVTGTPMPMYLYGAELQQLREVSHYVADLAQQGQKRRRKEWAAFFQKFRESFSAQPKGAKVAKKDENRDPKLSQRFVQVSLEAAKTKGCLSCHEGIEDINDKMMPHLVALAGGLKGRSCILCHEGNPEAATNEEAHQGMFPNPGSKWVVGVGLGCGKCHSDRHALTTLHTISLPHPVGGELMNVVSTSTYPSGGAAHKVRAGH